MDFSTVSHMFVLGLPVAEKIIRPIVIYVFLIAGLRLAGKRELAQLNPFDLVVLLTISNTVQNAIIGPDDSITGGIIGATTLLVVNYFVVRFLYHHDKLDRVIEGDVDTLIENGQVLTDRLKRELVTRTELEWEAHKQGFDTLDEIDRAVLDPSGKFFFRPKQPTVDQRRHDEILARLDRLAEAVGGGRES